jgi:hypothetical protein
MSGRTWRVAFITGSGSGIGLRLAERLIEQRAKVAIFDRKLRSEVREALGKRASERGTAACFHEVDVRNAEALERVLGEAEAHIGRPDLAINSAGVGTFKPFAELSGKEFERVLAVRCGRRLRRDASGTRLRPLDDHSRAKGPVHAPPRPDRARAHERNGRSDGRARAPQAGLSCTDPANFRFPLGSRGSSTIQGVRGGSPP